MSEKINADSVLRELISKAYKLDDGKMAEIFEADDATTESVTAALLGMDVERVSLLKKANADNKDSFNQGYAKAKKEERAAFENEVKEALGISSDTTGIDLINEVIAEKVKGAGGSMTEEDIKKSPVYQSMERQFKAQLKEAETTSATKLEELQKEFQATQTFNTVKDKASQLLAGLNPVQSKNERVASTIKNQFLNELKGYEYQVQDDGSLLVMKDGKVETNSHGHTKSFDDIVKEVAGNFYEFSNNNGGGNAGNENNGQGGGSVGKVFKNDDEANAYVNDMTIPIAERMEAFNAYNAAKSAQ